MEYISSIQNPKIKNLQKLQKPQERKKQGVFLVEGLKEINMALQAGFEPDMLFFYPISNTDLSSIAHAFKCFEISKEVFEKLAYREGSDGLLATFKQKLLSLDEIKLSKNPLIIAVEAVEKPGNLGAILRTADAAHVDAVLICDGRTDIFNPNVIRSSVGCVFSTQVVSCTNDQMYQWIKKKSIPVYAAALATGAIRYDQIDFRKPACIIMGTEADGLTDFWLKNSEKKIIIPMLGENDSLNVSVSAAVITFEALRQRNFKVE